ncbi:MAG: hypothetical protein IJ003_04360 [Candidatus Gastranaerophilales bacterium]|nr:hypothetical protein [Candidatus Gastranaerophilales bacterium]
MLSSANLNLISQTKPTVQKNNATKNSTRPYVGVVSAPFISNSPVEDALYLAEKNKKPIPKPPKAKTKESRDFKFSNILTIGMFALGITAFLKRKKF